MAKSSQTGRQDCEKLENEVKQLRSELNELEKSSGMIVSEESDYTFTNGTAGPVNDLHVEFESGDVKLKNKGKFNTATTSVLGNGNTRIDFSRPDSDLNSGDKTELTFVRNGKIEIKRYRWTRNGNPFIWRNGAP